MPVPAEVSHLSDEDVWLYVRSDHPAAGPVNLSTLGVEAAFVAAGDPATGDWKPAVWEVGTEVVAGEEFYRARARVGPGRDHELQNDVDYLTHVRVTSGTGASERKAVIRTGIVHAY